MAAAEGTGGGAKNRGGSYAIHAEIGAGGMATVHLGRLAGARGFARTVAIKVLHASYAKNPSFVARFLDEARLVGRIHHPNVMPTLDVIAEGDDLRIVMEYVAGESLDQLEANVRAKGERIPIRVACAIMVGVLHGLHAAHEAKNEFGEPLGIIHLDVSPQNILVGTDGTTRVLDFGVARARGERVDETVTGKSAYLAPEQVRRGEVSPRSDVFAASIVLWEMLTGESLFAADNHAATLQRVLGCVIPAVSDKVEDLPPRLDEVLKRGLRRDPAGRFATARDMATELEQAVLPALSSEVGRWVESVAEVTLASRAGKVREMEASSSARPAALPGLVSPRDLYAEQAAVNLPSEDLEDANTGSLLRAPGGPNALVPERASDGSVRWKARSAAPAARATSPSKASKSKASAAQPTSSKKRPSGKTRTFLWIALGTLAVAAVFVAIGSRALFLPSYVESSAIASAAAHGVVLTVSDASLSDDGVLLRGLTVKLVGVPQVSTTIASADLRVAWSEPTKALLGKTEVAIDGDVHTVLAGLDAWSKAHTGKGAKSEDELVGGLVEIPAAHVLWTHTSATDVTRIEAVGVSGAIGSPTSVSLGDDIHFLMKTIVMDTHAGTFGPWSLDVDRTLKSTRARLAFDPAVPDGANALVVDDAAGDLSFDVTVPRLPAAGLGVPSTAFGPGVPLPQQLEVALHYARLPNKPTNASLRAAFYGLRVAELGGVVDARASGEAAGPAGSAMNVKNGLFAIGPLRAAVTGTLTPGDASMKANLAWKADPIPCSKLAGLPSADAAARDLTKKLNEGDLGNLSDLARDLGSLGQEMGAVTVTGAFAASGTVVIDSGSLEGAKFATVAKNACGVALFQGK